MSKSPTLSDRASWLVNAGIEDTRRGLDSMTGTPQDIADLEAALAHERAQPQPRSSRLKPIEAKLRKFQAPALINVPAKRVKAEVVTASWDTAKQMLACLTDTLRRTVAMQALLGRELKILKKEHGMVGRGGDRRSNGHDVHLKKWPDLVQEQLGVSAKTADRWIDMWDAVRPRIKKIGGERKLIGLLETPFAKLAEADRRLIAGVVDKATDGTTQKELLEELKIVKKHVSLSGGDTSGHRKETTDEEMLGQLAFEFFRPIAKSLQTLRCDNDREIYLNALDLYSSDEDAISLTTLERDLEASLEAVRAAKAARLKANPQPLTAVS